MLLEGRNAVVYGAGGPIGGAVALAFAAAGAHVFLAGRTKETIDLVAGGIRGSGGEADAVVVDALDGESVDAFVDSVVEDAGTIDISFDLIGVGDVQGTPMIEMSLADYEQPIRNAVRSQFLTARAAARHMVRQGSGVILTFGGDGGRDPIRNYSIGGFQVAMAAVDAMRRQLAAELGPHGVRVLTIESGGILESIPSDFEGREAIEHMVVDATMLGRAASFADVGNAAVFAASDMASSMTGGTLNITCGATTT